MSHLLLLPRRKGWTRRACPPWRSRMTQIQALRERRWRRQTTACTLATCVTRSSRRAVRCCGTNMNIQVIFYSLNLIEFWLNESNDCCASSPLKRDRRNKNIEANNWSWLIIQHFPRNSLTSYRYWHFGCISTSLVLGNMTHGWSRKGNFEQKKGGHLRPSQQELLNKPRRGLIVCFRQLSTSTLPASPEKH